MSEILLIHEVAQRLRVSPSTVNRWLGQARKGESTFPLPISVGGGKGRWLAESIDQWVASQYVRDPFPAKTSRRNDRRNAKAHVERQANVDRALAKYRTKGDA